MRKLLDALADAHFLTQGGGTVRFLLPRPDHGYLNLTEAEADGAKILWRLLVRYYVYACHACVIIGLFVPWFGPLLLLTLWLVGLYLIHEIKQLFERKFEKEEGQHDWIYYQLSHSISRRLAVLLGWLATAVCVAFPLYMLLFRDWAPGFEPVVFICLIAVATRWGILFHGLASSPKAKEYWAQAAKP